MAKSLIKSRPPGFLLEAFLIIWLFGPFSLLVESILESTLNMSYEGCHPSSVRIVFIDFFLSGFPELSSSTVAFLEFMLPILISYLVSYILSTPNRRIPFLYKLNPILTLMILFIVTFISSVALLLITEPKSCSLF